MATFTRAKFYRQVMLNNAALQTGQDVEAEDQERIDLGAGAAFDVLEKQGIYGARGEYEADEINGAAFLALARYVANEVGRPDGIAYSDAARLSAEQSLCRSYAAGPTYTTLAVDYF